MLGSGKHNAVCIHISIFVILLISNWIARVHYQQGKLVHGKITHSACPAKILIFSPVDPSIRKAIIITTPKLPHNHPPYASAKPTHEAKEIYREAAQKVGIIGATVGKIDRGMILSFCGCLMIQILPL